MLPSAGRPPSTPHWYIRMLSVTVATSACIAWRLSALALSGQACTAHQAAGRFIGMVKGRQDAPFRRSGVDFVIRERLSVTALWTVSMSGLPLMASL